MSLEGSQSILRLLVATRDLYISGKIPLSVATHGYDEITKMICQRRCGAIEAGCMSCSSTCNAADNYFWPNPMQSIVYEIELINQRINQERA